jgi:excinuclease ABC subunit A
VPGGRCETCSGEGYVKIEMQFLADLYLDCDDCKGTRYKKETREITYRGKNIVDVLNMTVDEAIDFFKNDDKINKYLQVLSDVGLGYIKLGQPSNTLSGGEAQRIKLALHLSTQKKNRHTLFIFDEPTTGLHFDDISKLLNCFKMLIENKNSVLIIEHNLDIIKNADYVIDLGPEAGDKGGKIVAAGTPEEIAKVKNSYTGQYLKKVL